MSRSISTLLMVSMLIASCSSDGGDDERITRIDGPAVVVDEDEE